MKQQQLVFIENGRPVTDSLTVAEVFGKEHKHVLRDIRELECSAEFSQSNFGHTPYKHPQNGQTYQKCLMTEQGFTLLVMGYTGKRAFEFKEKYISEFHSMRSQLQSLAPVEPQLPATLEEYLDLDEDERGAAYFITRKQKKSLETQLAIAAPKVEAFNTFMTAENSMTMNEAAKSLGIGRNQLFGFLRDERILMASNLPYQSEIKLGRFRVKQTPAKRGNRTFTNSQTLVTAKGLEYIRYRLADAGYYDGTAGKTKGRRVPKEVA
jgi:Rha family phage regulatory protein